MKIQDQEVLGQNPQPAIHTTNKEFMANKSGTPRTAAQDAAAQISGNLPSEIGFPLRVIEVVAVEMDGGV